MRNRGRHWVLFLSIIAIVVSVCNPVNDTISRFLLLGGLGGLWLALFIYVRWLPIRRGLVSAVPTLAIILALLPGTVQSDDLRQAYVQCLRSFEGTPYHWGGESHRGIDCSGLPRRAMQGALLGQGLKRADGKSLRTAVSQWWHDTSARAFAQGYRNQTIPLGITGKIRDLDLGQVQPGDLAVTGTGVHCLVYLGEGQWIQADPAANKVLTQHGQRDQNPWFSKLVTLHRWTLLK